MTEDDSAQRAAKAAADTAEANARKAAAEARQAEAAAVKAEQDNLRASTPGARLAAEATDAQTTAAARRAAVTDLLPDLSTVKASTLTVDTPQPIWSDVLLGQATAGAARQLAVNLAGALRTGSTIFLTTDADLSARDGVLADVSAGLEHLLAGAKTLLPDTAVTPSTDDALVDGGDRSDDGDDQVERGSGGVVRSRSVPGLGTAVAAGVAELIPPLLSLFSAERAVKSVAVTAADRMALAAVAHALTAQHADRVVVVDRATPVPRDGVIARAAALDTARAALSALRASDAAAVTAGGADADPSVARRLAAVESAMAATDAFLAAVRAVPTGAGGSALTAAALAELVRPERTSHVLVVGVHGGAAVQSTENQPLFFDDRFATVVTSGLSLLLIETSSGHTVAAGVETGSAHAEGRIGDTFRIVSP